MWSFGAFCAMPDAAMAWHFPSHPGYFNTPCVQRQGIQPIGESRPPNEGHGVSLLCAREGPEEYRRRSGLLVGRTRAQLTAEPSACCGVCWTPGAEGSRAAATLGADLEVRGEALPDAYCTKKTVNPNMVKVLSLQVQGLEFRMKDLESAANERAEERAGQQSPGACSSVTNRSAVSKQRSGSDWRQRRLERRGGSSVE